MCLVMYALIGLTSQVTKPVCSFTAHISHARRRTMPQNNSIVILGPKGATFSYLAALHATKVLNLPKFDWDGGFVEVSDNDQIIPALLERRAKFGIIAAETEVRGRINESLGSFSQLVEHYENGECPVRIMGALRTPVSFALMAREGVKKSQIRRIYGHPQALAACAKTIAQAKWEPVECGSNGHAAQLMTRDVEGTCAALAPADAARMYGLEVLDDGLQDAPATTTFFVLGPNERKISDVNRALIVFRLKDGPMALVSALMPFGQVGLNMTYVHSFHRSKRMYDFIAEIDCPMDQIEDLRIALEMFERVTLKSVVLGPFPVLNV